MNKTRLQLSGSEMESGLQKYKFLVGVCAYKLYAVVKNYRYGIGTIIYVFIFIYVFMCVHQFWGSY